MNLAEAFTYLWMVVAWVCGIAVAKGFWITLGCVLLPPMAWIVLAERILNNIL